MGKYAEASARTKIGVHSTYTDDWVRVGPSKFLKKLGFHGNGLFANRNYKAGDVVIEYIGRTITDKDAEGKLRFSQYMFDVKVNGKVIHVIDGANNKYSSAAKFVNSSSSWDSTQRNAEFTQYNQRVYLVATKGIIAGTEIISYYGNDTMRVIQQS
jgi:SET domain-containing protein